MHARQHMSYTCDYAGPRSLGFYVFIACIVFYGCFCIYIAQCVSTGDLVLLLVLGRLHTGVGQTCSLCLNPSTVSP